MQPVRWLLAYNAGNTAPYVQGGDSGGGRFWGHVNDSTGSLLMGITSAQITYDGGGFGSGFVQLAAYRSWITATMDKDLADAQGARWASAVPEPGTWALWLASAGLRASRRAARGRATRPSPKAMLNKSWRVWAPWFGLGCKAQTTAIAQLWRGFATPQTAQNRADRAARDLFSVALKLQLAGVDHRPGGRARG